MPSHKTGVDLSRMIRQTQEEAQTRLLLAREGASIDRMMLVSFGGMAAACGAIGVAALTGLGGLVALAPDMGGMAFVMGSVCLKDALEHWNSRQDFLARARTEQAVLGDDPGNAGQLLQNLENLRTRPSMETQIAQRIRRNKIWMGGRVASIVGLGAAIPVALMGGIPVFMGAIVLGLGTVVGMRTTRKAIEQYRTIRTQEKILRSGRVDRMSDLLDRDGESKVPLGDPVARQALTQVIEQAQEARKADRVNGKVVERPVSLAEGENDRNQDHGERRERPSVGQSDGEKKKELQREDFGAVAKVGNIRRRKPF